MRQICLRIIFNMYINDASISQGNKGHRIPFTYMHMVPILRFLHHLYGDFSLKLYIFSQIYIYIYIYIYTNTFGCKPYYKYFHTTMHCIKGEEVKIIRGLL